MNSMIDSLNLATGGAVQAYGSVASRLLSNGMRVNALRTADVLRKDEWKQYDQAIVDVARSRLVGVGDLLNAGLRFDLTNAMGTTILEWEQVSDMNDAEISMSGVTEGQNDTVTFNLDQLPIPIVHKDFNINIRKLEASRSTGQSLDTTQARISARKVAELNETILFDGSSMVFGGGKTIQGYTNATNRNTGSLTADWALVGTTGEQILDDILAMRGALVADNMFGPYMVYVPIDYDNKLDEDFKAASDKSIRQRLSEVSGLIDIKPSNNLTGGGSGEVIMVQFTDEVVDMVVGQQPANVQWEGLGGFVTYFKVLSILVPRVRNDILLQSGIAHYSV